MTHLFLGCALGLGLVICAAPPSDGAGAPPAHAASSPTVQTFGSAPASDGGGEGQHQVVGLLRFAGISVVLALVRQWMATPRGAHLTSADWVQHQRGELLGVPLLRSDDVWRPAIDPHAEAERERAHDRPDVDDLDAGRWARALQADDPAFDVSAFLAWVSQGVVRVHQARCRHDLAAAAPLFPDGALAAEQVHVAIERARGIRTAVAEVRVTDLRLAGLRRTETFNTVRAFIMRVRRAARASTRALRRGW